jgi:L-ascorbate metabolism protein UlaG (beta-lactamase superfamily)
MLEDRVASERAGASRDRIVFLGHATFLLELGGVRLLTDPLLRDRIAHLRRQAPPLSKELTAGVRAALISHMHLDHLDLASLRRLGGGVQLVVPVGAAAWLRKRGFTAITELAVGEAARVAHLTVIAIEARHGERRLPGGARAQAVGYVVRGASSIYFAGDTGLFAGMAELGPGLDAALLPVAGWGSRLGPGHMGPLDAARAASLIRPRLAIPMHWGTLLPIGASRSRRARLGDPARAFARHVAELAPEVEARVLSPGAETVLEPGQTTNR